MPGKLQSGGGKKGYSFHVKDESIGIIGILNSIDINLSNDASKLFIDITVSYGSLKPQMVSTTSPRPKVQPRALPCRWSGKSRRWLLPFSSSSNDAPVACRQMQIWLKENIKLKINRQIIRNEFGMDEWTNGYNTMLGWFGSGGRWVR